MTRRRGFTLIELLAAIIIIGAVMGLATSVVVTALKTIGEANRHIAQARTLDAAMVELRKDAWGSAEMMQVDAKTILLRAPGGRETTWTITPKLVLRRSEAVAGGAPMVRNFVAIPPDLVLAAGDRMVLLQAKDSAGRSATVRLPSQLLLAGGKP